tara:strand:+ start:1359 stop:1484 length:126 start_codon:yes stop_codon:yes gene_type:complete
VIVKQSKAKHEHEQASQLNTTINRLSPHVIRFLLLLLLPHS